MISQNNGGIEKISQTIKNVNMKFNMRLNREILSNHPKQSHYEIFLKFRDTEQLYWTIEHKVSLKFLENSVNVGIWSKSPICACTPFDKGKLWCTRHRTSTNQHTRTEQIIIVYLVSVALPRAPNLRSPFQTGRQQEWRHRTGLTQVGNKSAWISLYFQDLCYIPYHFIGPSPPDILSPSLQWGMRTELNLYPVTPQSTKWCFLIGFWECSFSRSKWETAQKPRPVTTSLNPNQINPKPSAKATMQPWQLRNTNWYSRQNKTNARWMWNYIVYNDHTNMGWMWNKMEVTPR